MIKINLVHITGIIQEKAVYSRNGIELYRLVIDHKRKIEKENRETHNIVAVYGATGRRHNVRDHQEGDFVYVVGKICVIDGVPGIYATRLYFQDDPDED